jgi:hypothetical protein
LRVHQRPQTDPAMQHIPDILAIHEGFGHNRAYSAPQVLVEEIVIVLLQESFPVPIWDLPTSRLVVLIRPASSKSVSGPLDEALKGARITSALPTV